MASSSSKSGASDGGLDERTHAELAEVFRDGMVMEGDNSKIGAAVLIIDERKPVIIDRMTGMGELPDWAKAKKVAK